MGMHGFPFAPSHDCFFLPRWGTPRAGDPPVRVRLDARDAPPEGALAATRELFLSEGAPINALAHAPALETLYLYLPALDEPSLAERLAALPALREVHLFTKGPLDAPLAVSARRLPKLTRWQHTGAHSGDERALEALRDAPALRELRIAYGPALTPRAVEALATTPLEVLSLDETSLAPGALDAAAAVASLRALLLERVRVAHSTHGWAPLAALASLEALSLYGCGAGPKVADTLARLAKLRALDVGSTGIEGAGLASLAALAGLHTLGVHHAESSSSALATLTSTLDLRALDASSVKPGPWAKGLLTRGTLERIDLAVSEVPDSTLAALGKLPRLRAVHLAQSKKFTEKGVAALARCATLEELDVSFTELGDRALKALASSPALRDLNLSAARGVTDAGLRELARSPSLRALVASNQPALGAETFAALARIPTLEQLVVWSSPAIGPAHVAAVRAARPSLELLTSAWQSRPLGVDRLARVADGGSGAALFCAHNERTLRRAPGRLETVAADGTVLASTQDHYPPHADVFRACGTLVAYGHKSSLTVTSLDGTPRWSDAFPDQSLRHATASRDGCRAFSVDHKRVRAWDLEFAREVFCVELPWEPARVAVSLDGAAVTVFGAGVLVLRCPDGSELFRRDGAVLWARSFDGRTVDVVLASRRVERWSLDDGAVLEAWSPPPPARLVPLSVGPSRVVVDTLEPSVPALPLAVTLAGRTEHSPLRVLTTAGELWDRDVSVWLGGLPLTPELSEDGRTILLENADVPRGIDRYDLDALLAFARSAVPRGPA